MRGSLVYLTFVEMRRALHRRLVRWMIVLAVSLSALAGVIVYLTSRDPVALARESTHPARMVSWWGGGGEDSFLLTAALFLVVWLVFGVPIEGSLFTLLLTILLGACAFAGLGLLLGCRTEKTDTASGLMNLIMMPSYLL